MKRVPTWAWVGALALGLRLALFLGAYPTADAFLDPGSYPYLRLAHALVEQHAFVGHQPPVELFEVPGYPLFLTPFMLFPESWQVPLIILTQLCLDVANCFLVWLLARRLLTDERGGWMAGLWQATSGAAIVFSCKVLSETLFVTLFLAFLLVMDRARQRERSWRFLVLTAVLFAMLAHVRVVMLPLLPVVAVFLVFSRNLRQALLFIGVAAALLMPWMVRNEVQAGYLGFSTSQDLVPYVYHAAALEAEVRGIHVADARRQLISQLPDEPVERARYARRRTAEILSQHPLRYARVHLRASLTNLLPVANEGLAMMGADLGGRGTLNVIEDAGVLEGIRHYFADSGWALTLLLPAVLLLGAKYLLAVLGLVASLRWEASMHWLLLFVMVTLILVPGPNAHPRFRVPVEPILAIYAAQGLLALLRKRSS